jgi:transcriptional regulator with XRE-family HTH domain
MTIAQRVKDQRYAKGWGPDELASRAAISRTALYQIECGKTETPRAGTLNRIAQALGVPIEMLLGHDPGPSESAGGNRLASGLRISAVEDHAVPVGSPPSIPILHQKLDDLLGSPLGEGITRIVLESHRLLFDGRGVARG